jgi:hypothetical protein
LRPESSMVRRGSTVRVRQRALQKRRKSALFLQDEFARAPVCSGYGAVYGAFRLRAVLGRRRWSFNHAAATIRAGPSHGMSLHSGLPLGGCRTATTGHSRPAPGRRACRRRGAGRAKCWPHTQLSEARTRVRRPTHRPVRAAAKSIGRCGRSSRRGSRVRAAATCGVRKVDQAA